MYLQESLQKLRDEIDEACDLVEEKEAVLTDKRGHPLYEHLHLEIEDLKTEIQQKVE